MDDIQQKFFNFDGPCPPEIANCDKYRTEYKNEIEKYRAQGACNSCIERSVRNKYITLILAGATT